MAAWSVYYATIAEFKAATPTTTTGVPDAFLLNIRDRVKANVLLDELTRIYGDAVEASVTIAVDDNGVNTVRASQTA